MIKKLRAYNIFFQRWGKFISKIFLSYVLMDKNIYAWKWLISKLRYIDGLLINMHVIIKRDNDHNTLVLIKFFNQCCTSCLILPCIT